VSFISHEIAGSGVRRASWDNAEFFMRAGKPHVKKQRRKDVLPDESA
jgi:hypothetical protein